MKDEFGFKNM